MLKLNEKVRVTADDENFGKIGTVSFIEEKKGFRKYSFCNVVITIDGVEKNYPDYKLDNEIDRKSTFNIKMLKDLNSEPKKSKRKVNEDKEEHCINYETDVILYSPEGHNSTGDISMNDTAENTAEHTAENVAASVVQESTTPHTKRVGRPQDPNSAYGRAKGIYTAMVGSKRGEVIGAFVRELGIKEGSASVYYYNIKKGFKPV